MIIKMIALFFILIFSISASTHADNVKGAYFGAGFVESRTLYYGHISNGSLLEAGYDFNQYYSFEAKMVRTGGDNYDLNFLGANIGHTFNSSWLSVYGKIGIADITAKNPNGMNSNEEYENSKSYKRSTFALGAGVRFTPFSKQSGAYSKLELLAEGSAPLYTPIGLFLILGYKF